MANASPHPTGPLATRLSLDHADTQICQFAATDDAFCRALFHEHRADQFAPLGLRDDLLRAMLDQQFQAQRIAYAQRFPDAEQFLIQHAGTNVGRLMLALQRPAASPDGAAPQPPGSPTLHLIDITIAAAARNRGIGSEVVESLARVGHAIGATRFTLFVLQTNHAARRLYERLGFAAVAAADGVHIPMVRNLP
ncbi:MAG: GCN5-related N-acetyltransferase [Tardiphaga sp.]|jgi:ribosomal protein S18 acetylase RimI-like enzyme|nr:GCN5-related N-acetyltransferase [Tardiphaga sp.]